MKYEYRLQGLDCPACAAKIETETAKLSGIHSANCNLINATLTVETGSGDIESITERIRKVVHTYEPEVLLSLKEGKRAAEPAKGKGEGVRQIFLLAAGTLSFAAALLVRESSAGLPLFILSYAILGWKVVYKALRNLLRGQVFDENFLMSLATAGAFAIGESAEAVAVMLFYLVGESFQDLAVRRSKKSIADLMDIRPDYANVMEQGELRRVSPEAVCVGDRIVVKPGEKIPLDGLVLEGSSNLDTKALTGESAPKSAAPGDTVLSGCVNLSGVLTLEVSKRYDESTVAKIIDMVENAGSKKAKAEQFITRLSRVYTPLVVALAILLAVLPPLWQGGGWAEWTHRALVFLVVSCPCALVISIPLSFFCGIGSASKNGILVKGGNFLDALTRTDIVVFDKTGTLTKGVFEVTALYPAEGVSGEELLFLAAKAEAFSDHPIAASIRKAYGKDVRKSGLGGYQENAGYGVRVTAEGVDILAGNHAFMEKEGVSCQELLEAGTKIYVAAGKRYAGCILISDKIKADSHEAVQRLKTLGVSKTVMLTGDNGEAAEHAAKALLLDEVYAHLLPGQKVETVEALAMQKKERGVLVFVGDGINDAPVLARADIGVAMGALGSDAAIEAADVVLMTDEPRKLPEAIRIAKATKRIVLQNIVFALGVKAVLLILGAAGISGMWEAVFADVGVSLLAILNALRILRFKV